VGTLALTRAGRYRLLAHTADIGLEANAPTLEGLFVAAAEGFKTLVYGDTPVRVTTLHTVCLEAGGVPELMVVWLNELLYLGESGRLVAAEFTINAVDGRSLNATIGGEPFDPGRHTVERTAKAVTYHQLVVEERKDGWYARVYIDL
jgi:SHS2 domain-containing protein